jgi:16S rRNA G966 N2-methylase RsmD
MILMASDNLRQRADYTHKFNTRTGRHGWLRLTPAYSLKIVEELIGEFSRPLRVLDPFCGTATTGLSAAYHGHNAVTTEINPFLVWLGNAKVAHYKTAAIQAALHASGAALDLVERVAVEPVAIPPIHNIERWWSGQQLDFLRLLRAAIDATTLPTSQERNLLLVAFCRTLIKLSNASFNHQSMSFKSNEQQEADITHDAAALFAEDVDFVLAGAAENPAGQCLIVKGDARALPEALENRFDLVITSPPYANRMSYIRELRPYMYWLGYLINGRDAGELDWEAIGGTWGIATSRLTDWIPDESEYRSEQLEAILEAVAHSDNANGLIMANYIAKYFVDMWKHFRGLREVLADGARVHYIVGNSTFYGVLLPVEKIYADMLNKLGFKNVTVRAVRKRNSKKELVEFDVSAVW